MSGLSILLWPVSFLFAIAVKLRHWFYVSGVLRSVRLPIPVIIIGNLTVGGTGKTPLVLWLATELRRRGGNPCILSRGHGGKNVTPVRVRIGDSPAAVGDEPLLLAERSGCPVWIGADRVAAGRALLAAHPECDVILCDDGLQHYRLQRDLEIAVEDERGFGNGFLLPAGPLREPASRRVDARVINGEIAMADVWRMRLKPAGFYRVAEPAVAVECSALSGKRLHAVAGIGNPERFFSALEDMGLCVTPHPFPDHHQFLMDELEFADCDCILMTEKDAVKCRHFGRRDLIAARVDAELDPAFADFVWKRIHGRTSA